MALSTCKETDGDYLHSGAVGDSRRLLSVAEIQQVLRELQTRPSRSAPSTSGDPSQHADNGEGERPTRGSEKVPTARRPRRSNGGTPAQGWGDTAVGTSFAGSDEPELAAGWIAVLAAHAGAGASTVALAVGDAAAADALPVHLIDTAHVARSGLVAAASDELGTDVTGAWRRGLRTGVTIDRRAADLAPVNWPVPPVGDGPAVTVVDLGLAVPENLARLAADRARLVVVCRPTVPGVRLAEQLLGHLAHRPVALAAIGPSRWPGEVTSSLGPRLRALRAAGRVVPVPMARRLEITGPSSSPLPKSVRSAGRQLLALLDGSRPGAP
jgi:hypothetical protein